MYVIAALSQAGVILADSVYKIGQSHTGDLGML